MIFLNEPIVKTKTNANKTFQNLARNSILSKLLFAIIIYINVKQNAYLYSQNAGRFPKRPKKIDFLYIKTYKKYSKNSFGFVYRFEYWAEKVDNILFPPERFS